MLKRYFILKGFALLVLAILCQLGYAQNVAINDTGNSPNASAMLDVSFNSTGTPRGFLAPRMTLAQRTTGISSPAEGLLVYQTNGVEGFYYYDGSAWSYITTSGTSGAWAVIGNTSNATDFLGTTNNFGLRFRTNNIQRLYLDSVGTVAVGTSPTYAAVREKFLVDAGATTSYNVISGKGTINSYLQLNIQNKSNGAAASSDVVASNDLATESDYYVDLGINSSGNTTTDALGGGGNSYLFNKSGNLTIGTATAAKDLRFITGGQALSNIRMTINDDGKVDIPGNVGIGTTAIDESPLYIDGGTVNNSLTQGLGSLIFIEGSRNQFLEMNIQNTYNGNNNDASADIVATADNGTDSTGYINMGINSSKYRTNTGAGRLLNGPNKAYLYSTGAELYIGNATDEEPIIFFTNNSNYDTSEDAAGTERMRLTAAGELCLGVTSPYTYNWGLSKYKLSVNGAIKASGVIDDSDRRLKTNIQSLNYGLKDIMSLQPVKYKWIDPSKSTQTQLGLIAQDAKVVIPEVVYGEESKESLGINYTQLIPVLINAIKEQQKQIDELKKSDTENKLLIEELTNKNKTKN